MNPLMPPTVASLGTMDNPITWVGLLGVLPLLLFIWALVDLIKRPFPDGAAKPLWFLLVFLVPCLGPIIYLIAGRK